MTARMSTIISTHVTIMIPDDDEDDDEGDDEIEEGEIHETYEE